VRTAEITPLILTYNEAPNIARTLTRLGWASRVVVLDSFSSDETPEICRQYQNVDVIQRRFDDHTTQWNYGLDQVTSPWVLSLDADYVLTDELLAELVDAPVTPDVDGYFARFNYTVFGRRLRASLYPPRVVLFRRDRCRYVQDGHTQRLEVSGRVEWLHGRIDHDDRKPLDRWFADQLRYSAQEAVYLAATPARQLNTQDRIRRKVLFAPPLVLAYALVGQRLVFDAWPGWYYALQRTLAELMLSLRLVEGRLRKLLDDSAAS
jgi:glycosyltransferase involved in cell wall biosynthesis